MINALRHTWSGKSGHILVEAAISRWRIRVDITDEGGARTRPHGSRAQGGVAAV